MQDQNLPETGADREPAVTIEDDTQITEAPAEAQAPEKSGAATVFLRFLFVPAAILFDLALLARSTRDLGSWDYLYIILFDISWGLVFTFLWSLFPRALRRPAQVILLTLEAIPYGVEYFVYMQFKIFYDPRTIINGAGGVITGFADHAFRLIFSSQGIVHLIILFAPAILALIYLIVNRKRPVDRPGWRFRLLVFLGIPAFTLAAIALLPQSSLHQMTYTEEYSYPKAVERFGLLTAVRLDAERILMPERFDWTEEEIAEVASAVPEALSDPENRDKPLLSSITPPSDPVILRNELDIDFEALSAGADELTASLNAYVSSQTASQKNQYTGLFEGKNLILITAEAFSGDIIDPELTPTLYRLSTKGINFTDYYMPASAGTTGGEYTNIFGMLPTSGGSSMLEASVHNNYWTMGSQLDRLGYYGKMYHNNDYTYYDRHITHFAMGYSDGYMGIGNGMEEYVDASKWPESDLEMFQGTLPTYIDKDHFNIYYMTVSGHSGYGFGINYMSQKHLEDVQDLPHSEAVAAYIACNLELEDGLTYLVEELEKKGIADDTVIVLTADHFPYGLDDDASMGNMPYLAELYGYQVTNVFERDHNRLIIWSGCLEDEEPIVVDTPVSATDILPTLSNLFGLEYDSRFMPGRDVFSDQTPLVWTLGYEWKTDLGSYYNGVFTPASEDVKIPDDYVSKMRKIVSAKIDYCKGCLATDYFGYVFGDQG